uniref:MJ0042 family finger-like protein n=1 Tax=Rhodopseudomonas palustris (strain BisA53) TaxID=316055 RepID=Q07H32_RHOP5
MPIVCPHCTTSYAIGPSALGEAGRNVRCAKCKQVWYARPEDVVAEAMVSSMAGAAEPPEDDMAAAMRQPAPEAWQEQNAPIVESPSIASDIPETDEERVLRRKLAAQAEWAVRAQQDEDADVAPPPSRLRKKPKRRQFNLSLPSWVPRPRLPTFMSRLKVPAWVPRPARYIAKLPKPLQTVFSLSTLTTAMGALVIALVIWRVDVVKLMPQTADFYKLAGLEVNLRGLAIKDVKIGSETVDGKSVLVIEGMIIDESKKAAELPRLRFVVRDGKGTEIYAWNAVLEQSVLRPGEKAWFRSRLASPPAEARSIDVRFFTRRDLGSGGA